jgi:hypothetical protein
MYVNLEYYIDDTDYADWLRSNGIEYDEFSMVDPYLIREYIKLHGAPCEGITVL